MAKKFKKMKLIIAGGRDFDNYEQLKLVMKKLKLKKHDNLEIVSGLARGADTLGMIWADKHNKPIAKFPAAWNKHGRAAGYIRNGEMAEYATHLLAFWDGKSRGTKHMIDIARKLGLKIKISKY
jgi:hypothetical protein